MKKIFVAAVAASVLLSLPARAQWAVFDAGNFSQNVLTAMRTLQQIDNQVMQLQNQAQMLINQARNLKSLNYNSLSQILNLLNTTDRLLQQAQGLTFGMAQTNTGFTRYYPQSYLGASSSQMAADSQVRWGYSLSGLQTSMQMQSQAVQNQATDESTLSGLVGQSQSAAGSLQAQQATNQLIALQARLAMQEQHLHIAQDRATALEQARAVAAQAQSLQVRQQFVGGGPQYTPQSVNFYGP